MDGRFFLLLFSFFFFLPSSFFPFFLLSSPYFFSSPALFLHTVTESQRGKWKTETERAGRGRPIVPKEERALFLFLLSLFLTLFVPKSPFFFVVLFFTQREMEEGDRSELEMEEGDRSELEMEEGD